MAVPELKEPLDHLDHHMIYEVLKSLRAPLASNPTRMPFLDGLWCDITPKLIGSPRALHGTQICVSLPNAQEASSRHVQTQVLEFHIY